LVVYYFHFYLNSYKFLIF